MLIKANTEILIQSTPELIWNFASDPANWTASNSIEHFGLEFHNLGNRPATGVAFRQMESVAGIYADLRGYCLLVEAPNLVVWSGVATYRLLGGLFRPRIPEGGVTRMKVTSKGVKLSHDVFMDFPDTWLGRIMLWVFKNRYRGESAVYDHTFRELKWFKDQLEADNIKGPAPHVSGRLAA